MLNVSKKTLHSALFSFYFNLTTTSLLKIIFCQNSIQATIFKQKKMAGKYFLRMFWFHCFEQLFLYSAISEPCASVARQIGDVTGTYRLYTTFFCILYLQYRYGEMGKGQPHKAGMATIACLIKTILLCGPLKTGGQTNCICSYPNAL